MSLGLKSQAGNTALKRRAIFLPLNGSAVFSFATQWQGSLQLCHAEFVTTEVGRIWRGYVYLVSRPIDREKGE